MIGYCVLVTVIQVLVFSGFTNGQKNETNNVEVAVYYEALCPYAKQFIVNQLGPFLKEDLSKYINLTLIPYGKAKTRQKNDSYYEFTCHHKEVECYGNKLQACALVLLNNGLNTPGLGFNKKAVEFIVCLMKDLSPSSSIAEVQTAAKNCKLPGIYNTLIRNCSNELLGSKSLAHLGNLTNNFQNPLGNVPTIVFNDVFRKKESDEAEKNFKELFCSKIKLRNLTASCQEAVVPSTTAQVPEPTTSQVPEPFTSQVPGKSTGPTILPIPQLSLGTAILAFLVINSFRVY